MSLRVGKEVAKAPLKVMEVLEVLKAFLPPSLTNQVRKGRQRPAGRGVGR